jgi:hypothetical protein
VSVLRQRSTFSEFVCTFMPSVASRTHAAANTRSPTSTTHMRQTPTGRRRGSWQRDGISIPSSLAASHIVVPAGTVTSQPSIVRLIV